MRQLVSTVYAYLSAREGHGRSACSPALNRAPIPTFGSTLGDNRPTLLLCCQPFDEIDDGVHHFILTLCTRVHLGQL